MRTLWPAVLVLAGCSTSGGTPAGPRDAPDGSMEVSWEVASLPSGLPCEPWLLGSVPSGLMVPGRDCLSCHYRPRGGEPTMTVAGTVFAGVDDADDCQGVEGVEVVVVDAAGTEHVLTSNQAGNFYTSEPVVFPAHAYLRRDLLRRPMHRLIDHGSCNRCHTTTGEETVPGRIVAL